MLFILSAGRSGSTMLRKLLMETFFIHIPPESSVIIPQAVKYYLHHFKSGSSNYFLPDLVDQIYNEEFKFWAIEKTDLITFLESIRKEGHLELDRAIYGIYDYHRRLYNPSAKAIGDKTPYLVFSIREIRRVFPESKLLFLIRDPFAVVPSRMKNFNESLEQATNRWIWAVKEILKYEGLNTRIIRYEDLLERDLVSEVGEWAGLKRRFEKLQLDDRILGDTVMTHHSSSKGKIVQARNEQLKNDLSDKEVDFILSRTKKFLLKYGYIK